MRDSGGEGFSLGQVGQASIHGGFQSSSPLLAPTQASGPHLALLSPVLPTAAAPGAELPRDLKRQDAAWSITPEQRLGTPEKWGCPIERQEGNRRLWLSCIRSFTCLAKRGSSP